MTEEYTERSERFFDELAHREYDEIRNLFLAMARECALRSALESAKNPTVGIGQWAGGRISICEEWTDGARDALERAKGKASPEAGAGLVLPAS